jgi:uncharacterized protein YkwD
VVNNIVNPVRERQAVFEAFLEITNAPSFDPYVSLVTSLLYNSTSQKWTLSNSAVYTKPDTDPTAFQKLKAIPSITNSTTVTNISAVCCGETNSTLVGSV